MEKTQSKHWCDGIKTQKYLCICKSTENIFLILNIDRWNNTFTELVVHRHFATVSTCSYINSWNLMSWASSSTRVLQVVRKVFLMICKLNINNITTISTGQCFVSSQFQQITADDFGTYYPISFIIESCSKQQAVFISQGSLWQTFCMNDHLLGIINLPTLTVVSRHSKNNSRSAYQNRICIILRHTIIKVI